MGFKITKALANNVKVITIDIPTSSEFLYKTHFYALNIKILRQ